MNSPFAHLHACLKRACLEAVAVGAMDVGDGVAHRGIAFHDLAGDVDGLVGGVVEHLDVELVLRVVHLADGIHQAVDDVLLVEDRQLHGDAGQVREAMLGLHGLVAAVAVVHPDELIAVDAVGRQDDEDDEVGDQQAEIEGVGVVKAPKGGVEDVGAHPMLHTAGLGSRKSS